MSTAKLWGIAPSAWAWFHDWLHGSWWDCGAAGREIGSLAGRDPQNPPDATIGSGAPGVAGALPRRSAGSGGGVARPGSPARCCSARREVVGCADLGPRWCRIASRPRQRSADPRFWKLDRKTRFPGKPLQQSAQRARASPCNNARLPVRLGTRTPLGCCC